MQPLEDRIAQLERAIAVLGIPLEAWLSPEQAAKALSISRPIVMAEIKKAEDLRLSGKRSLLVYGQHYRNDQSASSGSPTWKVNLPQFQAYWNLPPEQRQ
jgi:hypothetical protein